MKLFTAMEDYTCDSPSTYTLEELEAIETNLNNEQRVLDSAVESYLDASTALKYLVKLEGLAPHNRGVYNVTMESINDQLGYPEGTVLSSEGIGESISKFAKKVWAKIVAAYRAVRDWIRKLFGMAPIPSEGSLKKTDDTIKEAADKGPTLSIGWSGSSGDTQQETDITNAAEEEMKRAVVDVDQEMEAAAKVRAGKLEALAKKKVTYAEHEAEAYAIKQEWDAVAVAKVEKAKELAEQVIVNLQKTYDNHEEQAHNIDRIRTSTNNSAGHYEQYEEVMHPKAYDIEMGISRSVAMNASRLSTIMVTDYATMESKYATDNIKAVMPFLNNPINTVVTEDKEVKTFDGRFTVAPHNGNGATINYVYSDPGGHWDVSYVETGENYAQIVANHEWFKTVTDKINSLMDKLTPEHFLDSEKAVLLGKMLSDDLALVGRKKVALMKYEDRNNKLVKVLMEDTNEATYRYLQDHYIVTGTDNRNIKD